MSSQQDHDRPKPSFLKTPAGFCPISFLLIAIFYLLTEHMNHVLGALPYLLLLSLARSCTSSGTEAMAVDMSMAIGMNEAAQIRHLNRERRTADDKSPHRRLGANYLTQRIRQLIEGDAA